MADYPYPDWTNYSDWMSDQGISGVGNQNPNQLDWYEGEYAFGSDPGQQGYGLSNLWRLYSGIDHLYDQMPEPAGWRAAWRDDMAPEAYDIKGSGEKITRAAYEEDYKSYNRGISQLRDVTQQKYDTQNIKTGKAGFASGGTSAKLAQLEQDKYLVSHSSMADDWQSSKLAYKQDIFDARKSYVDDLWSQYRILSSGIDGDDMPTGSDWGDWEEIYG